MRRPQEVERAEYEFHAFFVRCPKIATWSSDYQTNINSKMDIHIGKLIKEELRSQGRSVKWFESQINRSHSAVYDIFRSHDINTELLKTISKVLNHDFFIDLSEQMYGKTAQNCTESPSEKAWMEVKKCIFLLWNTKVLLLI